MDNKPKISPVVTNTEVSKKLKMKQTLSPKDGVKSVMNYAVFDVLIPNAKKVLYEFFTRTVGVILFGDSAKTTPVSGYQSSISGGINYSQLSTGLINYSSQAQANSVGNYTANGFDYPYRILPSKEACLDVIYQLSDIIEASHFASVQDLYETIGVVPPYNAANFGWKTMAGCQPKLTSEGWVLSMTRVQPIRI